MNQPLQIQAIPALHDNYIWLLHDGVNALVVDPGEAQPVLEALARLDLTLTAIWVTHHHADHTGGVAALREATEADVFGPAQESIPAPCKAVQGGDTVSALGVDFAVLDVPGHTAGHIAFFGKGARLAKPLLFSGDTLFSAGCGRLLEGTAAQMLGSLDRLANLPLDTLVCCGHEYTLANLQFAQAVEPDNTETQRYLRHCAALRERGLPTLPSALAEELKINPFLRIRLPAVREAVAQHSGDVDLCSDVAVFAALRSWKNHF